MSLAFSFLQNREVDEMKRIPYDKLVRDRIPEIIRADGRSCAVRVAGPEEYKERLENKLREEMEELLAPGASRREELADLLETIYSLAQLEGLTPAELEALRQDKAKVRGGFEQRLVLQEVIEP